jgi:hypothetical protein
MIESLFPVIIMLLVIIAVVFIDKDFISKE